MAQEGAGLGGMQRCVERLGKSGRTYDQATAATVSFEEETAACSHRPRWVDLRDAAALEAQQGHRGVVDLRMNHAAIVEAPLSQALVHVRHHLIDVAEEMHE